MGNRTKRKKHQYIVIGEHGPMCLCRDLCDRDEPRGGVLMGGSPVTVFPNWHAANRAIQRSKVYADMKGYTQWNVDAEYICRLGPLPEWARR